MNKPESSGEKRSRDIENGSAVAQECRTRIAGYMDLGAYLRIAYLLFLRVPCLTFAQYFLQLKLKRKP